MARGPTGMVRVYASHSSFQAHLVKSAFIANNLHASVRNEMLSGLAGVLPVQDVMVEVWVECEDEAAAMAILAPVLGPKPQGGQVSLVGITDDGQLSLTDELPVASAEQRCDTCGEMSPPTFGECWSCQTPFEPA